MLSQDWLRPWNALVSSSDSLSGFGICHAWWPTHVVGRQKERHRFRRVGSHSARESALTSAGLARGPDGTWQAMASGSPTTLGEAGWGVNNEFEEVPAKWPMRRHWAPKMWGRWRYPENILVLEARAVLKSLKRIALTRYGHDMRQLLLCDNMPAVLSFERCRSKSYKVLKVLREFGAYCFAHNIYVSVRWIPSGLNILDEPSRLYMEMKILNCSLIYLLTTFSAMGTIRKRTLSSGAPEPHSGKKQNSQDRMRTPQLHSDYKPGTKPQAHRERQLNFDQFPGKRL